MTDHAHERLGANDAGRPVSVSHLVHTLRDYLPIMVIALAAVMVGYLLIAVTLYLVAPSQRITTLPFRLDFTGAEKGVFPNGTKFSASDIVSSPVLLKVYTDNKLNQYVGFATFSRSVFVLESNAAYDALYADYQARLADPRLTAIDRERIQSEFNLKRESLSKSDYAISYVRGADSAGIPETVVRKVLNDALRTWADMAVREQHVTMYQIPVISPAMMDPSELENSDPLIAAHMLRAKAMRVIENIDLIRQLPAADLARSEHEGLSLAEVRVRVEDLIRYKLEPLVGAVKPKATTMPFLESQLAYDQRAVDGYHQRADGFREALNLYDADSARPATAAPSGGTARAEEGRNQAPAAGNDDRVMPQLSENFLDRLVGLAAKSSDQEYRQKVADDYRTLMNSLVPLEQAVAWDKQAIELARASRGTIDDAAAKADIDSTREAISRLLGTTVEIYQTLSRNLNPGKELYASGGVPTTRVERAQSIRRFFILGILLMLASIPAIVIGCLLHNRVREEEESEGYVTERVAQA